MLNAFYRLLLISIIISTATLSRVSIERVFIAESQTVETQVFLRKTTVLEYRALMLFVILVGLEGEEVLFKALQLALANVRIVSNTVEEKEN